MKSNRLMDRIREIQLEYRNLLKKLISTLEMSKVSIIMDEINVFWIKHIKEVELFLKHWVPKRDTYVFTASTYMGYDDNEHLPFLLFGEMRIFDDPLSRYAEVWREISDDNTRKLIYEQILCTFEDNIKLLDNVLEEIMILPLKLFKHQKENIIYDSGKHAFLSLFKDIDNIQDYFDKCKRIDDIVAHGRKDFDKIILFSEEDDRSLPFAERFNIAISTSNYKGINENTDSSLFFLLVYGYIQQAVNTIDSCTIFSCIPFIRNKVYLNYITLLLKSFENNEYINEMNYKMNVAYLTNKMFDKNKVSRISIDKIISFNKSYLFSEKLFTSLVNESTNEEKHINKNTVEIIERELECYYLGVSEDKT